MKKADFILLLEKFNQKSKISSLLIMSKFVMWLPWTEQNEERK